MKDKPFELILEDSKKDIVNIINKLAKENNLSFYWLDLLLNDIHEEIRTNKINELHFQRSEYEKSLLEQEENKNE